MRDFEQWLETFTDNINDWTYYVNFDTARSNTVPLVRELALLNTLKLSENIEDDFVDLVEEYPKVLKAIPLLLAVRGNKISITDEDRRFDFNFSRMNYDIENYIEFMQKTGLFRFIQTSVAESLVDIGMGINVGLDSNARKNRGGHLMENLVEFYLKEYGFVKNETYFKEMYLHDIEETWGYDLSSISDDGTSTKRFDFVVKPHDSDEIYLCECNCYTGGGSKLNETARSYKQLALEVEQADGANFVWFTDGAGWEKAKRNLRETFNIMDHVYNINDIKNGIMAEIFI